MGPRQRTKPPHELTLPWVRGFASSRRTIAHVLELSAGVSVVVTPDSLTVAQYRRASSCSTSSALEHHYLALLRFPRKQEFSRLLAAERFLRAFGVVAP